MRSLIQWNVKRPVIPINDNMQACGKERNGILPPSVSGILGNR
jgi:hypothetical protein